MMNNRVKHYFNGKHILITGASSGLGKAVVEALSPYDVTFCLLSRNIEAMRTLVESCGGSPAKFYMEKCDVRDRNSVQKGVNRFLEQYGFLDVAWINAGVGSSTSFHDWDWSQVESILRTNLDGAIYTTQICLEHMVPRKKGAIVGISSAAAMRGLPARSIYSVSKIGLSYYLESLAAELPEIQFTTIYPGFVDTPINRGNPHRFWLMQPDKAAPLMLNAVARRKSNYIYPFRMRLLFRLVQIIPSSVYRKIGHRMKHYGRPSDSSGMQS